MNARPCLGRAGTSRPLEDLEPAAEVLVGHSGVSLGLELPWW